MKIPEIIELCTKLHDADTTSIQQAIKVDEIRFALEEIERKNGQIDDLVSLPTNLFMGLIWNMDDDVKELLLPKLKPYITDEIKETMILAIEEIKKVIG